APVVEDRVEQFRDALALILRLGGAARRRSLRLEDERQSIEELAHPRRQRGGELVERRRDVALEGRGREAFDERPAEVQSAQLCEREAGVVEMLERPGLELPVLLAVMDFVEEREAHRLQRLEIAPDRAGRDLRPLREVVDRQAPRGLELAQDRPLPDD